MNQTLIVVPLELFDLILGKAEELAERVGEVELLTFIKALDIVTDSQRREG